MAKLVWRVKVVADLGSRAVSETEVARIERDDYAGPETVGLSLNESKQLTAAIQAEIVRCQAAVMGERFRGASTAGQSSGARAITPPHSARSSVMFRSRFAG